MSTRTSTRSSSTGSDTNSSSTQSSSHASPGSGREHSTNDQNSRNSDSVASRAQEPDNQASGQLDSAAGEIDGFLSEVTGAVQDPLSMLVGTGVEFVINYVQPVQDAIQLVTGDGPALEQSAAKFDELRTACDALATELADTFDGQLADWRGEAANSARSKLAEFVEGVKNTGLQSHNIAELLRMSAVLMEAAEEVIKGILTDFLTWAIATWVAALASAVPTAGASTAAATAATGVQVGITCSRTAMQVQRILRIIEMIGTVIDTITAIIDAVRIAEAMHTIVSGDGDQNSGEELAAAKESSEQASDGTSAVGQPIESVAQAAGIDTENGPAAGATTNDTTAADASTTGNGSTADHGTSSSQREAVGTDAAADQTATDTNGADAGADNRFDLAGSVTDHGTEQLGNAADSLQEQAQDGGFSDVPSDETISGQLNI